MKETKKEIKRLQDVLAKIRVLEFVTKNLADGNNGIFLPAMQRLRKRIRKEMRKELD
jgi:hypothetical protein